MTFLQEAPKPEASAAETVRHDGGVGVQEVGAEQRLLVVLFQDAYEECPQTWDVDTEAVRIAGGP